MRAKVRVFPKNDENFRANYIFLHIRTKIWDSLRMEKSGCISADPIFSVLAPSLLPQKGERKAPSPFGEGWGEAVTSRPPSCHSG